MLSQWWDIVCALEFKKTDAEEERNNVSQPIHKCPKIHVNCLTRTLQRSSGAYITSCAKMLADDSLLESL
jgi:hypothetical protein